MFFVFFFSSRRRYTRCLSDWSSDVCSSDLGFGLAPDHRGAHGLVYVRLETFVLLVRDVCVTLAEAGFKRIVLLNGHYVNRSEERRVGKECRDGGWRSRKEKRI